MDERVFILPATDGEGHTLVFAPSAKSKSLMPDNNELTMGLATKAFQLVGANKFSVSASLSADNTNSLRNFGLLQSMLLMAYREGQKAKRQECADICTGLAGSKWVSIEAAGECADAILASGGGPASN